MWTEQKQQSVEAAARTMWAHAWQKHVGGKPCTICKAPISTHVWDGENWSVGHGPGATVENAREVRMYEHYTRTDQYRDRNSAPLTPEYARLSAAELLGMIEQANGCELAVIIEAAKQADCVEGSCNGFGHKLGNEYFPACTFDHSRCAVDVAEFASACAVMAMQTGGSWFDSHAEFKLPIKIENCARCGGGTLSAMHRPSSDCTPKCSNPSEHHTFVANLVRFMVPPYEWESQPETDPRGYLERQNDRSQRDGGGYGD